MKVKILGISGSHRDGATNYCVQQALKAAEEISPCIETEFVSLRGKKIGHCVHCNACLKNSCPCIIKDDFQEVYEKFLEADAYIIGTPVYQASATPLLQDFFSRIRPTGLAYPGLIANRVGGAIATGGTRNGGQEFANLVIQNFYATFEILFTAGPMGNYSGAVVWSKDMKAEGAAADEMGMGRVLGLGRRIGEVAMILKAGKEAIAAQGMEFDKVNKLWVDKKDDIDAGVL